MATHGERLKLRLFLEGVEVPISSIQIQALPNAPLMAAIQVPPVAEGTRLMPRTLVHVFFLDPYAANSAVTVGNRLRASQSEKQDPSAYQSAMDQSNGDGVESDITQYKLLFVGEILGFDWVKDQATRALVLQCADLSNYWDYAYQWSNTGLFGPGIKALFSGGSTNLFTDFLLSSAEVITNILRTPAISFPDLKGLAGGIIHLLESIGGSYYYDKRIAGQNIFFTLAELRLHITQMIIAVENDPTASRLLALQGYGGLMSRMLGGMGGQTSIRQSINALQGIIFHETYAQTSPKYIPGSEGAVSGKATKRIDQIPALVPLLRGAQGIADELGNVKLQLRVADNRPDVAIFAQSASVQKNLRDDIILRLRKQQQLIKALLTQTKQYKGPNGQRDGLEGWAKASGLMTSASQLIGTAATLTTRWKATNDKSIEAVTNPLDQAIDKLRRVAQLTFNVNSSGKRRPARLAQQILRPDVWFSAPPRCNVLFPEHYTRLQYKRAFMEEPTRLLLKTNDEFFGEDELFDRFYFAPKTKSVQKSKVNLQALLQNDLLEHELFTGILPVFEKMGELNIFAARGGTVKDRVPQVGLAQRSANFLYFKYRFASRQMVVSGRFNPFISMGFPGLVIDKYADERTLQLHNELLKKAGQATRDINQLLGTSFLGNFTQVTHTANQGTGATEIVMSYPRQPDESVEYLGATDLEEVTVNKRFQNDATRVTDVASVGQPALQSLGPNLGRIVRVDDVTDLYKGDSSTGNSEDAASTKPLLLFSISQGQKPREPSSRKRARVPVGSPVDARFLDNTVIAELGIDKENLRKSSAKQNPKYVGKNSDFFSQPRFITVRAYRVYEEVPRYRQTVVDLPAEEYIRPGWYGDIWHPAKIGEAYDLFLSTGAITDPHTVNDPTGAQGPAANSGAQDAMDEAATTDDGTSPAKDAPFVYQLEQGATIEQAAAFLIATYSRIKQGGLDVEEFIRSYTWRPVATMADMFGTRDLQLAPDGNFIVQGIEGFHSRAFGPYENLFGLVTAEIESVVGLKRGTTAAQKGDTRKTKQDAVKVYLSALGLGRAILG